MATDVLSPLERVAGKAHNKSVGGIARRLAVVSGIDLKTVAATILYSVPAGVTAIIEAVIVEITAATAITADAKAGVGIAAGEDDIFASETLVNVRAAGDAWGYSFRGKARTAPAGSDVKLGVDTGATGTALTARAHVIGYTF